MFHQLQRGHTVNFDYRKSNGRLEHRSGTFVGLEFGAAGDSSEDQWFLRCLCDKTKVERSFAMERIAMVWSLGATVFWEQTGSGYRRP